MNRLFLCAPLFALVACVAPPQVEVGRALFAENCVACHGPRGKGDGPAASALSKTPPDLTTLSARNNGVFPRLYVMGVIDGYNRRVDPHSVMPEFGGQMLNDRIVGVDTGDGLFTPTPEGLVELADYIEGLQG